MPVPVQTATAAINSQTSNCEVVEVFAQNPSLTNALIDSARMVTSGNYTSIDDLPWRRYLGYSRRSRSQGGGL